MDTAGRLQIDETLMQELEEVKKTGAKVVMKNNVPEVVLMSPEEYVVYETEDRLSIINDNYKYTETYLNQENHVFHYLQQQPKDFPANYFWQYLNQQ